MTAIVGYVENNKVWLGCDSAGSNGSCIQTRKDSKIFHLGEMIIGFTTSFRMGQILQYHLPLPKQKEGQEDFAYLVTEFIPAVKTALKDNGFNKSEYGQDTGGTFLVGYRGHLYRIEGDYQVSAVSQNYHSCGCGEDFVLGAMYAMDKQKIAPKDRIIKALKAAEEFSSFVRGPFNTVNT